MVGTAVITGVAVGLVRCHNTVWTGTEAVLTHQWRPIELIYLGRIARWQHSRFLPTWRLAVIAGVVMPPTGGWAALTAGRVCGGDARGGGPAEQIEPRSRTVSFPRAWGWTADRRLRQR